MSTESIAERVAREWYFGDNSKDEVIRQYERENEGRLLTQIPLLNMLQRALAERIAATINEARLEEAKLWNAFDNLGCSMLGKKEVKATRLAELERAAKGEK